MQNIIKLFADIQTNPNNINAYRQLINYYLECNMLNEAEAFILLLKERGYEFNNSPNNPQQ